MSQKISMFPRSAKATVETIGIDLGDKTSRYCVLSTDGEVLEEGHFRNTEASLARHFRTPAPLRIALEVGTQSAWISRVLASFGHAVVVANARELRALTGSARKNDRNDAEKLARYARVDPALLRPVAHRSPARQRDLNVIRGRDALVRARTLLVNSARGIAKGLGLRLPPSVTTTFGVRARTGLPESLQTALSPVLAAVDQLSAQIDACETELLRLARECYPEVQPLCSVPGVGALTALTFVLTLGERERFAHSRDVGPYLGLQPRQKQSGERDPQLGITKTGNGYLRRLLVQCAHYMLGPFGCDSNLRRWGLSKTAAGGKNAKKRAIVALARKLAVLLHRLWVTNQRYEPFFGLGA